MLFAAAQAAQKTVRCNVHHPRLPNRQLTPLQHDYNACNEIMLEGLIMATMTIRNLDDELKARLRVRAAQHGKSMEEEARSILRDALKSEPLSGKELVQRIREMVEPYGGIELELPPREPMREPLDFSGPEFDP